VAVAHLAASPRFDAEALQRSTQDVLPLLPLGAPSAWQMESLDRTMNAGKFDFGFACLAGGKPEQPSSTSSPEWSSDVPKRTKSQLLDRPAPDQASGF